MGKKNRATQTHKRGVPIAQYMVVYRAVLAGEITWELAEEQGLVCKIAQPGPKASRLNEIRARNTKGKGNK